MNTLESNDTASWLLSYLSGKLGIPFYEDSYQPDENNPVYPVGIIKLNRDAPLYVTGGYRVWTEETWLIFVATQGSGGDQTRTLSDKLAAALERLSYIALPGGAMIVSCSRQNQYRRVEQEPGGALIFRERGALWKVIVSHA